MDKLFTHSMPWISLPRKTGIIRIYADSVGKQTQIHWSVQERLPITPPVINKGWSQSSYVFYSVTSNTVFTRYSTVLNEKHLNTLWEKKKKTTTPTAQKWNHSNNKSFQITSLTWPWFCKSLVHIFNFKSQNYRIKSNEIFTCWSTLVDSGLYCDLHRPLHFYFFKHTVSMNI